MEKFIWKTRHYFPLFSKWLPLKIRSSDKCVRLQRKAKKSRGIPSRATRGGTSSDRGPVRYERSSDSGSRPSSPIRNRRRPYRPSLFLFPANGPRALLSRVACHREESPCSLLLLLPFPLPNDEYLIKPCQRAADGRAPPTRLCGTGVRFHA